MYFSVSMFLSLPFGMSLTFLLGLLSAVLIAVAFRHLATKLSFYFACFYYFFLLFSCAVAIAVSPLLFSLLGLPCRSLLFSAIFNSSRHLYCHAIFIAAVHFVTVQPDSNNRGFSFKAGPFFCWMADFALVLSSPYSSCC